MKPVPDRPGLRVNDQIRVPNVRVVKNGQQLGVMPTMAAKRLAADEGLDLVEIAPRERPPVCHILDYGHYRYEQSVREREQRRKQKVAEEKSIRLSPSTDDNDLSTKVNQARDFLTKGKSVSMVMRFSGRKILHTDRGQAVMNRIVESLADVAQVDGQPRFEGKNWICRLRPRKH